MPTLIYNTGFEHAVASTTANPGIDGAAQRIIAAQIGAGASIIGAAARSGSYGLRMAPAAASSVFLVGLTGATMSVHRFLFRVNTLPGATAVLWGATHSTLARIDISSTGVLTLVNGASTDTGPTITADGLWHRVDVKIDATTGTRTIRWTVDGVDFGSVGVAVASTALSSFQFGNSANTATFSIDVDDVAISSTSGDYPLGDGYGGVLLPSSLTVASSGAFVRDATATAIDTTDWARLDEVPIDETSTFIRQTTGSSTQPGGSTSVGFSNAIADTINGVRVFAAYGAASTNANTWRMWAAANGSDTYIHGTAATQPSIGSVGPVFASVQVGNGGVAWTDAMLDGATVLFGTGGGTDVNPVPRMNNVLLEVDYVPAVVTPRHQAYTLHRRQALHQAVR